MLLGLHFVRDLSLSIAPCKFVTCVQTKSMTDMCFVSDKCFHEDHAACVKNVKYLRERMCQVNSYCYIPLLDCLMERTALLKPECISSHFTQDQTYYELALFCYCDVCELFHVHCCDAFISLRVVQRRSQLITVTLVIYKLFTFSFYLTFFSTSVQSAFVYL